MGKRVAAVAALIALLAAVALALDWWLGRDKDGSWQATIMSLATIVLVVVTYQYVRLTGNLVKAQLTAEGRAGEYQALLQLHEVAADLARVVLSIAAEFPIGPSRPLPRREKLVERARKVMKGASTLTKLLSRMPSDLVADAAVTSIALAQMAAVTMSLGDALKAPTGDLSPSSQEFWNRIKEAYETQELHPSDRLKDYAGDYSQVLDLVEQRPSWTELVSGLWIDRAETIAFDLEKMTGKRLRQDVSG